MNRYVVLLIVPFLFPLALFGADAKELNKTGLIALQSGNFAQADDCLQKAMKLSPNWAEPYFNYWQLMRISKKAAEGRKFLKRAYDLEPGNVTYKEEIVRVLKEDLATAEASKDPAKISAVREKILQVCPAELTFALPIIKKHFEAKEFDLVRSKAKEFLEKNQEELAQYSSPEIGEMMFYLAKVEFDAKEYKPALDHAEKATHYPTERVEEAKALVGEIKKFYKKQVDDFIIAGKKAAAAGNAVKAVEEFNKGLAIDPENEIILAQVEQMDTRRKANELVAEANKLVSGARWLEARDMLEAVLRVQPKNAEARENLKKAIAFEESYMKRLGKAEKLSRSTGERIPMLENFIAMGKRFLDVKNYKDAQTAFDRGLALIELDPNLEKYKAEIDAELGKITSVDSSKQSWEKGREHYKSQEFEECLKVMSQLPGDYSVDLLSYLSYCHWKLGDIEKAKEFAHRQLDKQGDNNRAKFVLANIFHESGDNTSAFKLAKEIRDSDPDYPGIDDLTYKTGALHWSKWVIPLLIIAVLLYIAYLIYGNLPEYFKNAGIKRGKNFLAQNMFKECVEALVEVKKMPNVTAYDGAVISRILAQCFLKSGLYDKAVGECKHLLSINPADADAHHWLGNAYLGRRVVAPESLPELLTLYKTEKTNKALVGLLGQYYTSQKILAPEGVEVLERWHEMESNNPDLLKALGKHYLQKGKSDATAMRVFETMITTSKAEPEFMLGVAKLHLRMGKHEECLKICETVLTMDMNNELVHPILREAYKKMERITDLIEIYRAYLSENPYNVAFQKGLSEAQKMAKAAGISAKEQQILPPSPGQPAAGAAAGAPSQAALKDNEILCKQCGTKNLQADYYCQACGFNIGKV